nr:hypothetical protein [Mycobacterium aquaticum]
MATPLSDLRGEFIDLSGQRSQMFDQAQCQPAHHGRIIAFMQVGRHGVKGAGALDRCRRCPSGVEFMQMPAQPGNDPRPIGHQGIGDDLLAAAARPAHRRDGRPADPVGAPPPEPLPGHRWDQTYRPNTDAHRTMMTAAQPRNAATLDGLLMMSQLDRDSRTQASTA